MKRPKWHDAYDAQMALWRWYRTAAGQRWMRASCEENMRGLSRGTRAMLGRIYDGEMGRLIDCDPLYVSAEMCEVVNYARETFAPEPVIESDFLTPRGFLWFERPMPTPDKAGLPIPIRAISWAREYSAASPEKRDEALDRLFGEGAPWNASRIRSSEMDALVAEGIIQAAGVDVTLYADTKEYRRIVEEEYDRKLAAEGRKVSREQQDLRDEIARDTAVVPVVPFHITPWWFTMTFDGNDRDEIGEETGARGWWTLAQTTLRLMQQKRPVAAYGRPDRPTRRAAERLGFPPDTEVVIVRLRREEAPRDRDAEPTGRTLSHRHIRTGHWRNQWYPTEQIHRQIFIFPTVVGDESLPLIARPRRVFQWTR